MSTNFYQVVNMSDEEKLKMYLKLPKKKLAEMVIQLNKLISPPAITVVTGELTSFTITKPNGVQNG